MKKVLLAGLCVLFISGAVTAETVWQSEVVSSEPGLWEASLALDQDNNPHVSYRLYYVNSGTVQYDKMIYSYKDAQGWINSTFDSNGGAYESLALDSQGLPHISYYDTPGEELAYAHWNGTSWQKEIVDTYGGSDSTGGFTSLVLDENDNPKISYLDWDRPFKIKYASNDGISWEIQDFPGWAGRTDMTLDDSGNPHIVAGEKYGFWDGASWNISTYDASSRPVAETSIKLDSAGNPHIAYINIDHTVKYAYWDGLIWQTQALASDFSMISLDLDSSDIPHIMFGSGACKYATLVDSSWTIDTLFSGHFEDFILDSSDLAHFVYTQDYNQLIYVNEIAPVEVFMKFTPQALNLGSNGRWVKAHFVLPDGFSVDDVDVNRPAVIEPSGILSEDIIVSVNEAGLVEVVVSFDRQEFCSLVGAENPLEITVAGFLTSGQSFYGTDTIKVTANTLEYVAILASYWLQGDCGAPGWCSGIDADQDSFVDYTDFALLKGCCIEVVK